VAPSVQSVADLWQVLTQDLNLIKQRIDGSSQVNEQLQAVPEVARGGAISA
jgi:hypothetical protein